MAAPLPGAPIDWLEKSIVLPDGVSLLRLHPITRRCKGNDEAKVSYLCRKFRGVQSDVEGLPKSEDGKADPLPGPSDSSNDEMRTLMKSRDAQLDCVPHLRWTLQSEQPGGTPVPGGYVTIIVMSQIPGSSLEEFKFWAMKEEEQQLIRQHFCQNFR
ncbi:hypothetical protein DOTSEDRAFT_29035 [Dothistroma septosporum NZE10]|uniref:Uncharacterized protein n=1 Tax=Dothistroma septosporum (strain NZE10 / CBS 128990) TaxID=675120 RepID=M2YIT4_DOTSN|nr:hypothetical protein DOTSEDRAFT_29035 [Dothistroma septosporum NZE10]